MNSCVFLKTFLINLLLTQKACNSLPLLVFLHKYDGFKNMLVFLHKYDGGSRTCENEINQHNKISIP